MERLRVLTAAEQVAGYLGRALVSGEWGGRIPGGNQLAGLLGVGRNTVEAALKLLEDEGVLAAQGPGRRRVVLTESAKNVPTQRVTILLGVAADRRLDYIVDLQHKLVGAGQVAFYAEQSQVELGMDVKRIARMVARTGADAWVVVSGSREVLEWFIGQRIPVFALFGRRRRLPVAGVGPDKASAYRDVVRHLVALGHRRVVLVAVTARRRPEPGLPERAFLEELESHGIPTGPYHLPDWEESPEGLQRLIDSLFKTTPPTALLIDEACLFHGV